MVTLKHPVFGGVPVNIAPQKAFAFIAGEEALVKGSYAASAVADAAGCAASTVEATTDYSLRSDAIAAASAAAAATSEKLNEQRWQLGKILKWRFSRKKTQLVMLSRPAK